MGRDAFLAEVEKEYGAPLRRAAGVELAPRPMADKHGHIGVHPQKQPGLNYLGAGAAGRPAHLRADARPRRDFRALRQRHAAAHRLAEPADLRRRRPRRRRLHRRHRGARPGRRGERHPARPGRLHRQCRLQVRGLQHQGPCAAARRLSRSARRGRPADQHPSHRLPPFLRPALCRRHRPARLQGRAAARRQRRGLSRLYRRRRGLDRRAGDGARVCPSVRVRRPAAAARAAARGLARPSPAPAESFFEFCRRHEVAALRDLADRAPLRALAA